MPLFLPTPLHAYGSIGVINGAISQVTNAIAGTFDKITGFANDGTVIRKTTPDNANDKITVSESGDYYINFYCSYTGSVNTEYTAKLYDEASGVPIVGAFTAGRKIGVSNDLGSMSFGDLATLSSGDAVHVRIAADGNSKTFTPEDMSLVIRAA